MVLFGLWPALKMSQPEISRIMASEHHVCKLMEVAKGVPLTYAVSLLEGIWKGDAWWAHLGDVAALAVVFIGCTAVSAKVFRWE